MELGLDRVLALLSALNNPHTRVPIIHVAGTNGKGSVCAYLTSILYKAGFKVGRFNSPHLIEPRDSITINNIPILTTEYRQACDHVDTINQQHLILASPFEKQTCAAFWWFDNNKVDLAVIEVGVGGRLDATNVCDSPIMSVITSIGMDHATLLGGNIASIAFEKAGIMKPQCKVVIGPQTDAEAERVLVQHARLIGCEYAVAKPALWDLEEGWATLALVTPATLDNPTASARTIRYPVPLQGDYQLENSAVALDAVDWLRRSVARFSRIKDADIINGMRSTRWPGRLELMTAFACPRLITYGLRELLVDGAHNPPAAAALRRFVDQKTSAAGARVHFVFGATQGKDFGEILSILLRPGDTVSAVGFSEPEGMSWVHSVDVRELVEAVGKAMGGQCEAKGFDDLPAALSSVGSVCAKENNCNVVLCGSLYLVADLYRLVGSP